MIQLNILPRCNNCPEFKAETSKSIMYGDEGPVKVNIQIICAHRGLCDRILEHLKNESDGQRK